MKSFMRERLYYEIAMSIGNSLDISAMLKEGLSSYLRKLNCLAGAVLRCESDGESSAFKTVYAIPRRMRRNSVLEIVLADIPGELDADELRTYMLSMPLTGGRDSIKHYFMELPEYGVLVLVKSAPGLSRSDLKSLAPINRKLAEACRSCETNDRLQREIKERLKAEANYKAIFDNAVEGVFQASLDGRFLIANPAMARILGYDTPEELIAGITDLNSQLYVRDEVRDRHVSRLMKYGQVSGFEAEVYRKDGSIGWMSSSSRLVVDDAGEPVRVEGMSEDITARKLALIALREAKREAESLSQLKSNFLSMVSHELRTPLTSILGFSKINRKQLREMLGMDSGCPDEVVRMLGRVRENTSVIIDESERLAELIFNVLSLSELEAGVFEWKMEEVSMVEILDYSLAAFETLLLEEGIALKQDIAENLPVVNGDRERLARVVINLVSNAVKFSEDDEIEVSAGLEGGEIVVRVRDTGVGIPEDNVDVIFDKFRQLGDSLTDKPQGSGLGLPISKEIVEHHGGRIWVEPAEQGGSVFAFALPVG